MKLIWFQRPDGLWNADCMCGGACCGIAFRDRGLCEERHLQHVGEERESGKMRLPCGPKFPDANIHMPAPLVFP
jgi:hypothetical protein